MKKLIPILFFLCALGAHATNWGPARYRCPVCKKMNTFLDIVSYGGYIYRWPEKYQYVFWPATEEYSFYCCKKCNYTACMFDFYAVPKHKLDTIRKYLKSVSVKYASNEYYSIPITTRLQIAENIYSITGQNHEFWSWFYRVKGFYYDRENQAEQAMQARLKALHYARLMLSDTIYGYEKKEVLLTIAAMYNFTHQRDSAIFYLLQASRLTYRFRHYKDMEAPMNDKYLSDLIKQYLEMLHKEEED